MIRSLFAWLMSLHTIALVATLVGVVTSAHSEVFAVAVGNERLTLSCEGTALVNTACRIDTHPVSFSQAVRFTGQPTRYAHLFRRAIEKALKDPKKSANLSESEISLLRDLDVNVCHPADDAHGIHGDLLQVCGTTNPSTIVLFMRGLCDRCEFEPLLLKR